MRELDGTSQSLRVASRDEERMLRPVPMMAVDVMERVWPRKVRAGVIRVPVPLERSAGRMLREKSAPAESKTREEGKNWRWVTVLRCGREDVRADFDVMDWEMGNSGVDEGRGAVG